MVAGGGLPSFEESPSCAERGCLVKAREAGRRACRQSRLACRETGARATETNPDAATRTGWKG